MNAAVAQDVVLTRVFSGGANMSACLCLSVCLQCRAGSYRLRSKCHTCPNTAWLLFLSFSIAIVAAVAAAIYLNSKRINLAGLSVGVVRVRSLYHLPTHPFMATVARCLVLCANLFLDAGADRCQDTDSQLRLPSVPSSPDSGSKL